MIFELPGPPIPKKRPRFSTRGRHTFAYDSQKDQSTFLRAVLTSKIKAACNSDDKQIVMEATCLACASAFDVELTFHMPNPRRIKESARNAFSWLPEFCTSRPDIDNLEKMFLDLGNGILWTDDSQIISLKSKKLYSQNPRTIIKITARYPMQLPDYVLNIIQCIDIKQFDEMIHDVKDYLLDIHEMGQEEIEFNSDADRAIRAEAAANLLIKMAKLAKPLEKIRKLQGVS